MGRESPTRVPEGEDPKLDQAEDCLREGDKGNCTIDGAVTLDRETDKSNATLQDAAEAANGMDGDKAQFSFADMWPGVAPWDRTSWRALINGRFDINDPDVSGKLFTLIESLSALAVFLIVIRVYIGIRHGS